MKILIDGRFYGLEHAGLGRYVINLIKSLSEIDSQNRYVLLLRRKYFHKINLKSNWQEELADINHYGIKEQIYLPSLIKKIKPDIVHYPHFNIPVFSDTPFIVTIHDMIMHKSSGKDTTTRSYIEYLIKRLFYKYVFRKAVIGSEKIIVPSCAVKNEIANQFKVSTDKIYPIYEGYTKTFSEIHEKREILSKYNIHNKYFLYVGNAYPHKNIPNAIKAIKVLNKNSKKVKYHLVMVTSRGVFRDRLNSFVKTENLAEYVNVLGYIEDKELAVLYKNSIAFIYPSKIEGFGLQGIEAMAAGTILIASDIMVFREIYKNNALYFDPDSVFSIVETMNRVVKMTDRQRGKKINKAKLFIKKYSWKKMAKETVGVYDQLSKKG